MTILNSLRSLVSSFSKKSVSIEKMLELIHDSGGYYGVADAAKVSAMLACTRVISTGVAQVPLKLLMTSKDGIKNDARNHALYDILNMAPNDYMTSFEWRELMVVDILFHGFHCSYINRVGGVITELIPIPAQNVLVEQDNQFNLSFKVVTKSGEYRTLYKNDIFYVKGMSFDGVVGQSVKKLAANSLGISLSLEKSISGMAKNGISSTGIYSMEGNISEIDRAKLTLWLKRSFGGDNAGTPIVLDRSAKFHPISMTNVDAQTLETRLFQLQEICRFVGVSPLMIYADEKLSTYAGSVAATTNHVVFTLDPWYVRIQQAIDTQLLTKRERNAGYYSQFYRVTMLQGDLKTTIDAVDKEVNGGIITPNEGRAMLDLNPIEGDENNKLRVKSTQFTKISDNTGENSVAS